jgi:heme exporter protein D
MGGFGNRIWLTAVMVVIATAIIALNMVMLVVQFFG